MTDAELVLEHTDARYDLRRPDGTLVASLDYRDDGRTMAITRVFTVPTFRGRGYAAVLVSRVAALLRERGDRQVLPVCWYAADWFDAHADYADLVRPRAS